ncbi:hypothetical protein SADUNF_Sadunf03G0078500 [Salix dunnii]|uniref:Uncharacterized protein n=1 Tax=Salix dunnii TaxID=1413687 RepID=A0A835N1Y0_9ROSI|nr:hypothetical protein SADUNF_Sadunf03G0078500 [Salix dunnii]
MKNDKDSLPISFMAIEAGDLEGGTEPCRSNSASSYKDTFADYFSSSTSNSSKSCNSPFAYVYLGSETVVDKEDIAWETKIKKGDAGY